MTKPVTLRKPGVESGSRGSRTPSLLSEPVIFRKPGIRSGSKG